MYMLFKSIREFVSMFCIMCLCVCDSASYGQPNHRY